MIRPYQMCTVTVMDTTDPDISFDEKGVCNYVSYFEKEIRPRWFPNIEGEQRLHKIVEKIKMSEKDKEYDSIIGLSGGVDSSYLALKVKELGLRPLVVHVDAGWNSELAVKNIECIIKYCNFDLYTHVMNWEDMKQLQLAYLRSGVANQDVPQDHAFFAAMYHFSVKNKIKYVINGGNFATEGIFPRSWQHAAMDAKSLKAIFKRFGNGKLKEYKTINFFQYYFWYPFVLGMKVIRPLNYMPYNREKAMEELQKMTGWRPYGRKHCESVFTKFFQNYYLVERFGFDKRKPHLSSMILSDQITREQALSELQQPFYDKQELNEDKLYIRKKLGLSEDQFEKLLKADRRYCSEFRSNLWKYKIMKSMQKKTEDWLGRTISNYS